MHGVKGPHRHIVDDRKLYRPKEEVHIRGYLRTNEYDTQNSNEKNYYD